MKNVALIQTISEARVIFKNKKEHPHKHTTEGDYIDFRLSGIQSEATI